MAYHKVKNKFRDKDTEKVFNQGDLYTHEDAERVTFLVEQGFIDKEEVESEFPKHMGGGWYELSNGEKVQGKEEASVAEKKIGE
ncbi:hypothetical protein ACIQXU_16415 [Peribacillus sp. NPDC097284]|uniref:hypothetical protein n=1 Tax=Peribacillus sp. NPDC097284 TaxID=3364401 RepID=UPI003822846F